MMIRKFNKIKLNHWQKLIRNLTLIFIFLFLSILAVNFNKFTKASALHSMMNSYLVKNYKVIAELSPNIMDIPGDDGRYLVEVKDSYLIARIFPDGLFWSEGYVYEFPKENITLVPLDQGISSRNDHTNIIVFTSCEDAVSAKMTIHCKVIREGDQDIEYVEFEETYVNEATISKDGFFQFRIDSKYELDSSARRMEELCFLELEEYWDNIRKQPLKNITIDVEFYYTNHNKIYINN